MFAFGREARHVLVADRRRSEMSRRALASDSDAVTWSTFERMTRLGAERLRAALLIRKGPLQ
jgi:hypothetical protein